MNLRTVLPAILLLTALVSTPPVRAADDAASLYKAKCASCHAPDGSGSSPTGKTLKVPDLRSDEVQKKTDAQLIEITAAGKGKMPAYKDKLTNAQIKDLVAYTRNLAKKK